MEEDKNIVIMIADDIPLMRSVLKGTFMDLGYHNLIEASNGNMALTLYKKHRPDISFLDINMPIRNGLECLRRITRLNPDAFVTIISADGTLANVKAALAAGSRGFRFGAKAPRGLKAEHVPVPLFRSL